MRMAHSAKSCQQPMGYERALKRNKTEDFTS
jgi:hypothetical protein